MTEKAIGLLLLAALLAVPIAVYVITKRQKGGSLTSRFGLILLSVLLAVIAYVGTFAYALEGLEDLTNPAVPFAAAVIGNVVMWSFCLGAWFFAFRFFAQGCRSGKSNSSSRDS